MLPLLMNFELPSQRSIATKIIQIKIRIRPFPSYLTTSCASYLSVSRSLSFYPCIHCTSCCSMLHPEVVLLRTSCPLSLAPCPSILPVNPIQRCPYFPATCASCSGTRPCVVPVPSWLRFLRGSSLLLTFLCKHPCP